jgi:serine protease Do
MAGCATNAGGIGRAASSELGLLTPAVATASVATGLTAPAAAPPVGGGPTAAPLVQTPATNSAAAIQNAFEQVARAADPAVVTITTLQRVPTPRDGDGGFDPFAGRGGRGGFSPFGRGGGGGDPLDQMLRQFQRQFDSGQDDSGGIQPQRYSPGSAANVGRVIPAQDVREGGSSSGAGPLVGAGLGSGFLIRQDGLILTNAHVVHGADRVTVKLADGREFQNARVLGQDERTDIAVVKIPATGLPTLPLGSSEGVQVGDWAIAVGNPFGLERTLTVGVISAKNRDVSIEDHGPGDYLQTDATINPGNSGGPLLDINGRVVGINDAIYSESGGSVGIGFAVPIDTARQISDILVRQGRVQRAYLGVDIGDIGSQAAAYGLPAGTKGVLIESVSPGGPAAAAGLQPGDIVTAINGQPATTSEEMQRTIGALPVHSTATLTVLRAGQTRTITAELRELPETDADGAATASDHASDSAAQPTRLGVQLVALSPDLASQLDLHGNVTGVVVTQVAPGSAAQVAGIQEGDVIERVGLTPVTAPADVKNAVNSILSREGGSDQKSVALYVNRHGQERYIVVNL